MPGFPDIMYNSSDEQRSARHAGGTGVAGEGACVPIKMMNNILIVVLMAGSATLLFAQTAAIDIIPKPQSVTIGQGSFVLNHKTKIVATDESGRRIAGILNDILLRNYGFKLEFTGKPQKNNAIVFITALPTNGPVPRPESYDLSIDPNLIH